MELLNIIYNDYVENEDKTYKSVSYSTKIIKDECELKIGLNKKQKLLLERILLNKDECKKIEQLELIEFVLKNYAKDYVNKTIKYK